MAKTDVERGLNKLEADLKRLEGEYTMYFAGRLARPPLEARGRVEQQVKRYDRSAISNYGDRFRFTTIQTRFAKLIDLWDRGLRAREEGRPGPFTHPKVEKSDQQPPPPDRILHVAAFRDPAHEMDKLKELYASLDEARREVGDDGVPFQRFAELVKHQVEKMQADGSSEVAFRVAVKDGKVNFTARALKGLEPEE